MAEGSRRAALGTFDRLVGAGGEIPARERAMAAALAFEAVGALAVEIEDA